MSFYRFGIKSGTRGSAANHIEYITRQGSYAARGDLVTTGYGNLPSWANDQPELLFIASDKYERKNGSPYRQFTVSLPNIQTARQNVDLARKIAHELAGQKPFLYAVHSPVSSLEGESNPHVHIVVCDRVPDSIERPPEQMFKRYDRDNPERGGCRKDSGGMNSMELRNRVILQRRTAAEITNTSLEENGYAARVDHRTLEQQGKRKKPERYLGPARIRMMTTEERQQYVSARHREPSGVGDGQRDEPYGVPPSPPWLN